MTERFTLQHQHEQLLIRLAATEKILDDQIMHRYPGMTKDQVTQLRATAVQRRINTHTN